ncbi:transposase [Halopseudomonas sp.]|uniref:REP-associated tyrosine transposase n=1 Tax=Halopseudomonas sp. TaxID=2901191 RepID=UPI003567CB86
MPPQPQTGTHQLQLGRISEPGRCYLLTSVTRHRAPVFADLYAARTLIRILAHQHRMDRVDSHAFVVMPDHLHWLVQLKEDRLDALMGRVKSVSSRQIDKLTWQPGFHDHALQHEDDLRRMARHIIVNPLRAGLSESIGDYSHWDAVWL